MDRGSENSAGPKLGVEDKEVPCLWCDFHLFWVPQHSPLVDMGMCEKKIDWSQRQENNIMAAFHSPEVPTEKGSLLAPTHSGLWSCFLYTQSQFLSDHPPRKLLSLSKWWAFTFEKMLGKKSRDLKIWEAFKCQKYFWTKCQSEEVWNVNQFW